MGTQKNKKTKRIMSLVIFFVIMVVSVGIFYYQYQNIQQKTKQKITYVDGIVHNDFNSRIIETQQEYSAKIDKLLMISGAKKAFASGDRAKLFELLYQTYKKYKADDPFLKIMTFRLVDGSTFLRVHKPQMYGDKLNQKRTIIFDTARLQKRLFGFEIGKLKMSYRVVTPIFYKNKYIGLVEVGISTKKFTEGISNLFDIENALVVQSSDVAVSSVQKKYFRQGNFSLVDGKKIFKKIFKLSATEYKDKKSFLFTDDEGENDYFIVNNLHLLNQNGQVVAKILLAYDMTSFQKSNEHFEVVSAIVGVSVTVLLLFVVNLLW